MVAVGAGAHSARKALRAAQMALKGVLVASGTGFANSTAPPVCDGYADRLLSKKM
jgi:hypothetical protein